MPLTLVIFLTFNSKNLSLYEHKNIYINFYGGQDSVLEGPKMNKMGTHDHWLKCGFFDQMYNSLALCEGRLLA